MSGAWSELPLGAESGGGGGGGGATILPTGTASTLAYGAATVAFSSASNFTVAPSGLPSTLAYGAPTASFAGNSAFSFAPVGLSSTAAFGAPTFAFATPFAIVPAGLPSTAVVGVPSFGFTIPDTGEPVTLGEAKLAARVDTDELDDLILALITAAREQAEHITGRTYRQATVRRELPDWPSIIDAFPVAATACAISYWTGAAWADLDAAEYLFAPGGIGNNGTVIAPFAAWPALGSIPLGPRVRVDFTAGPASRADVPQQVKLYIKACVAAWLKTPEAIASNALAPNPMFERLLDRERLYGI